MFSKDPKLLVGIKIIRPVKQVLKASIAAREVSLSPRITKTLGSIVCLLRNFFLLKAGMCSGTVNSIYPVLVLTENVDRFLKFGPDSV